MAHRPMFRSHHEFTVLRAIRLTSEIALAVGDTITLGMFPKYRLMRWYTARAIAQKGSQYAVDFIKSKKSIAEQKIKNQKNEQIKELSQKTNKGVTHAEPATEINTSSNTGAIPKAASFTDASKAKSKQIK